MTVLQDMKNQLALVTGAGDGIGAMLARKLADTGLRVCVADIREEAAKEVAAGIGDSAFSLAFDVSDREACFSAAEELTKRGETLNLLWLNAGVGVGSPILSGKPHAIEWGFSVNVLGIIWTAQAFVPLMQNAKGSVWLVLQPHQRPCVRQRVTFHFMRQQNTQHLRSGRH